MFIDRYAGAAILFLIVDLQAAVYYEQEMQLRHDVLHDQEALEACAFLAGYFKVLHHNISESDRRSAADEQSHEG